MTRTRLEKMAEEYYKAGKVGQHPGKYYGPSELGYMDGIKKGIELCRAKWEQITDKYHCEESCCDTFDAVLKELEETDE